MVEYGWTLYSNAVPVDFRFTKPTNSKADIAGQSRWHKRNIIGSLLLVVDETRSILQASEVKSKNCNYNSIEKKKYITKMKKKEI